MKSIYHIVMCVLCFGLVLGFGIGWVKNIIQIYHCSFETIEPIEVLRVVGIFVAPLGAVLGWM